MDIEHFRVSIGKLRSQYQKTLNDTYIWTSLLLSTLELIRNDDTIISTSTSKFRVPSKIENKTVKRTTADLKAILNRARSKDLYYSVFVFLVAQVESYLSEVITLTLKYDNRRLKNRVQGVDHISRLDVNEVIDCSSREEIIDTIISKELLALFYAGPSKQSDYLRKVLGVDISDDFWLTWVETKASRDIIVHNSGIINNTYLEKAGKMARGKNGDQLKVDNSYFESSIAFMKSLIGRISTGLTEGLKKVSGAGA
jgi:hypothetical protein